MIIHVTATSAPRPFVRRNFLNDRQGDRGSLLVKIQAFYLNSRRSNKVMTRWGKSGAERVAPREIILPTTT